MDTSFHFTTSLQRLCSCTHHSQLIETAHREALGLPHICHPTTFQGYLRSFNEIDWNTHSIYPEDAPPDLWPKAIAGDGNCLFRSASVIAYGNESHHIEMRLRTSIELLTNLEYYLNTNSMFNSDDNLLLFWLANFSASNELSYLNMHIASNCRTVLMDCITQALTLNTWVGFWHVIALASVLGVPLRSVYPSSSVGISNNSNVRYVLNRTIFPRSPITDDTKTIMWTSTQIKTNSMWTPNHFVPCLQYVVHPVNNTDLMLSSYANNTTINERSEMQECQQYKQSLNHLNTNTKVQSLFKKPNGNKKKNEKTRYNEHSFNMSNPKKIKLEAKCTLTEKTHQNSNDRGNKKYKADINAFNHFIGLTPNHTCHFCHRLLFPDESKSLLDKYVVCGRCYACVTKNQSPNLSYSNHFDPGSIPQEILSLNLMEKRLLSQIQLYLTIITLPGGQFGQSGQAIHFPINVTQQWNELPKPISDIVMIMKDSQTNVAQFPVSHSRVHKALL